MSNAHDIETFDFLTALDAMDMIQDGVDFEDAIKDAKALDISEPHPIDDMTAAEAHAWIVAHCADVRRRHNLRPA